MPKQKVPQQKVPQQLPKTLEGASQRDEASPNLAPAGFLAPAVALIFAGWLGGFASGADGWRVVAGMLVLLGTAVFGAWLGGIDPLGLSGPLGRLRRSEGSGVRSASLDSTLLVGLPWMLLLAVSLSWWASPVRRAGLLVLCYGPWLLLTVPTLRWSMATRERRAAAEVGFALAVLTVGSWALLDSLILEAPRVAMPLGHHNLLALWLVAVLPLGVLPTLWNDGSNEGEANSPAPGVRNWRRWLGLIASAVGLLALLSTRSLAGAVGLSLQLLWVALRAPGARTADQRKTRKVFGLVTAAALLLAVGWRRLGALLVGGQERSFSARWEYLQAALGGFLERPLLGWGPGSSAWTLSTHGDVSMRVVQQGVTDAHSLPLDALYEVGSLSVLLALLLAVCCYRANRTAVASTSGGAKPERLAWISVAGVSLLGFTVASLFAGFFDVLALWVLVPILLAARSAAEAPVVGERVHPKSVVVHASVAVGALALSLVAVQPLRAHLAYQRAGLVGHEESVVHQQLAVKEDFVGQEERVTHLREALRLDPNHPLVGSVLAAETMDSRAALVAAEQAQGIGALFLRAGWLYMEGSRLEATSKISEEQATLALVKACDLAVSEPIAPFLVAQAIVPSGVASGGDDPNRRRVLEALARSVLVEPRILATPELLALAGLRKEVVGLLEVREEIPIGWRAALVESERVLANTVRYGAMPTNDPINTYPIQSDGSEPDSQLVDLVLYADEVGETSLSLFSFRRLPQQTEIARVTINHAVAQTISLPPATEIDGFDPRLFVEGCRLTQ